MVLTLKGKDGLEHDNPYQVGQSGLIGNPAAKAAFDGCRRAADGRHRLPVPRVAARPARRSIQIDARRSTSAAAPRSTLGLVGDAGPTLTALLPRVAAEAGPRPPRHGARGATTTWRQRQQRLVDPDHDASLRRPDPVARSTTPRTGSGPRRWPRRSTGTPAHDAVFTTDTGMSTVWLSRFVDDAGTAAADRLVQPRLDGQRDAAGARRAGARPRPRRSSRSAATAA